jgi:hypothetical protein
MQNRSGTHIMRMNEVQSICEVIGAAAPIPVRQKEIVASAPAKRGAEIDANGVPNVSVVMLLMFVTYWSSSTFVT